MKAIPFNEENVKALKAEHKTATRRKVRGISNFEGLEPYLMPGVDEWAFIDSKAKVTTITNPYHKKDILFVRETWKRATIDPTGDGYALREIYLYKADEPINAERMIAQDRWHPATCMPLSAARMFLRVKDVRIERLQDIDDEQAKAEGANYGVDVLEKMRMTSVERFAEIWDRTVKTSERPMYGWKANPYVWVIEFELL